MTPVFGGGLEKYSQLVKADPPAAIAAAPRHGVRITYLGTSAYLLESRDAVVLIDPYFSRQSLYRMAFRLKPVADETLVTSWLRDHPRIDAVLVTHGHVDHLFDVPEIMRATGAKLIASSTSVELVRSTGIPAGQTRAVRSGSTAIVRHAVIHVLPATHDRLFGGVPLDGAPKHLPPEKISDWVKGEPLAFIIEMGGKRIFMNSGGRDDKSLSYHSSPVDLAIVGVSSGEAIRAARSTIAQLHPRYILPSHQDYFFRPLRDGFAFMLRTNFPEMQRVAAEAPGQLILLDYFKPWTLR